MRRMLAATTLVLVSGPTAAADFAYNAPGDLVSGSGTGREDDTVHLPGMRFPIERAPAYLNSQVWGRGGLHGDGGHECDAENYSYPWWDNYCESRRWPMPLCPAGTGHQGQDIRPSTCEDDTHWVVATESGVITHIGSYSVYHQGGSGIRHRYLHMAPSSLQVVEGERVSAGERIGRVSDAFGSSSTTVHLHYDMNRSVSGLGNVYVTPYMSLVRSYEDLLGLTPGESASACTPEPVDGAGSSLFKDMPPGSFGKKEAEALYEANITNGCSRDPLLFCPDCATTRYMMAVFLVHATGTDFSDPPATPSFEDVPADSWYYPFVEAAKEVGITNGCNPPDNDRFCPEEPVTRAQAAAFIVNATGWPTSDPASPTFDDVAPGHWAYRSVETVEDWCVTNGCGDGSSYCPDDVLTRAQAAIFLARAFDLDDANSCVEYCDDATCEAGSGCEEEWSACGGFDGPCDTTGTQSRRCHQYACAGSAMRRSCEDSPYEQTRECTREVDCSGPDAGAGPGGGGGDAGAGASRPGPEATSGGGCGCRATGPAPPRSAAWPMLLLGALWWRRRRPAPAGAMPSRLTRGTCTRSEV